MTDAPTTLDEVPWDDPAGKPEPRIQLAVPRKCRHPRDRREFVSEQDLMGRAYRIEVCRCGHRFDPAIQRRGRNVRKVGKGAELRDARQLGLEPRGTSRDPEDSGGALDPAVVQSKTGPKHATPAWIRELEALERVAQNRPRILVATEKPGRGSRPGGERHARRLYVMFEDEFIRLTGLDARRRNLEGLASAVEEMGAWQSRSPMFYTEAEEDILDALRKLDETPGR